VTSGLEFNNCDVRHTSSKVILGIKVLKICAVGGKSSWN